MDRSTPWHGAASPHGDTWRSRNLRALVVDDSVLFRAELTAFLGELGVHVIGSAASGVEAIEQARRLEPDLVLMDLDLPIMSGLEATRRLCSEPEAPVVIIVSIYDDPHNVSASARAGAACLVGKSTLVDGLPAALSRVYSGAEGSVPRDGDSGSNAPRVARG